MERHSRDMEVNMEAILKVERVSKLFQRGRDSIPAVDDISFEVFKGETFGIVGESGSGKSTLSRLLMGLIETSGGDIYYKGENLGAFDKKSMRSYRRKVQMIFQDPYGSLDPRMNILDLVSEPLHVHKLLKKRSEIRERVKEVLSIVSLPSTDDFLEKSPEEISGGQRQRIGIARSIITGAEFIIADEPVSMLDTTIKARIVSLLKELKEKLGLTYIFITHEIGIAYYMCDRIAVMYLGQIMESGSSKEIIRSPQHPYTKLLMEAVPPLQPDENWGEAIVAKNDTNSVYSGVGCRFCPRCPNAMDICRSVEPENRQISGNRFVRCHLFAIQS